ncbi:MAG: poly-gamma-glutamate biosynthesis protein PgsC [Candidatus Marinimicrobia bacterium]|jgi:poly-gamma-glutamate biosynthesis protein PgsC/CapC|nr:poly-gamma-glutamate biosynthesis protein PgsC [Candidatus Neomarinimicrobiota bacterium]MBT3937616.1 poly-gamma-glutamate biosynthesis protein PgsC [Candidatus Neomarinimicrobiota bacterium]MBT3960677.1 poly-gamma-glutamate biosynthesis protein PgsC [Candidatus Neomarinimicrobiota bacterium]MBT4382867.1 poly-gamma-glutamate biosynthesis protein PgsC [Candidatus Neomarinimicrobiota bacterium]MBT4635067.1 poly-gamma-glutamate biosynthesis protein PgsC [Candidatus Neomarinimicrobiota bacterium
MVEVSIGLGIVLSLILSESLGVTAGGIIVPGYISLYLHQPLQVLITFVVAAIVYGIIHLLSKVMFLYGKRRLVLALILGFFLGYISRHYIYSPFDNLSFAVIGNIIPGLIANWMDRQGVVRTLSVVIVTAVLVKLLVMIIFGGQLVV